MKIDICDCCREVIEERIYKLEYYVHLDNEDSALAYIDKNSNRISGRVVSQDLCISCYNGILSKAVIEFKKRRQHYRNIKRIVQLSDNLYSEEK